MSKYSRYDYVRADMDYCKIPEKHEPKLREIYEKDNSMTFRYDADADICVYSPWQDCETWRDIYTNEVVQWNSYTGQCVSPIKKDVGTQLSLVPVKSNKTKKYPKIAEPVETLYNKVVPKKPLEITIYQKA